VMNEHLAIYLYHGRGAQPFVAGIGKMCIPHSDSL
jgi:hypothetical protein